MTEITRKNRTGPKTWRLALPDWGSLDTVFQRKHPFALWTVGEQEWLQLFEAKTKGFRDYVAVGKNCEIADDVEFAEGIINSNCLIGESDVYGTRYSVDIQFEMNGRSAVIRTNWIVRNKEDFPRLASCYIL